MFGDSALPTACRTRDEPYVVVFGLIANMCGHGVIGHHCICLFGVPHRLRGCYDRAVWGHVGWRDWGWPINGYRGIVGEHSERSFGKTGLCVCRMVVCST